MGCNGPTATETRDDDPTLLMGCGKATGTTGGMGFGPASGSFARHQAMPLASQMAWWRLLVRLCGSPRRRTGTAGIGARIGCERCNGSAPTGNSLSATSTLLVARDRSILGLRPSWIRGDLFMRPEACLVDPMGPLSRALQ